MRNDVLLLFSTLFRTLRRVSQQFRCFSSPLMAAAAPPAPPAYGACSCGNCTLRFTAAQLLARPARGWGLRCCGLAACVVHQPASAPALAAAIAAGHAAVIRRKYRNTPNKVRRFKAYRKLFFIRPLTNLHHTLQTHCASAVCCQLHLYAVPARRR